MTTQQCFSIRSLLRPLAIIGVLGAHIALASAQTQHSTVVTDRGPVQGLVTADGRQFLGIPYAAPPVGSSRWRPPQTTASWQQALDASHFGHNCPQGSSPFGIASATEDCLNLNVYTPPTGPFGGALRRDPVMVYIHGGAFRFGESNDYDPRALVQRGVVVVTINYRLGALGFMAHPALTAESPDRASGNYGLMDQQEALRWVRRNISRFGGNENNVTIFGESAGGVSVHAQLVSSQVAGLFQGAIAQSGAYALTETPLATAEAQGTALATALSCTDLACLRAVPVTTLLATENPGPAGYIPDIDGKVLTQSIGPALASGAFTRVPVIEGSTHDEYRLFVALFFDLVTGPITAAAYPAVVGAVLGVPAPVVSAIVAQYPLGNYASPDLALAAVGTDAVFACNTAAAAQSLQQYVPTWAYEFNDPNAPQPFLPPVSFPYGAFHTAELQYLFGVRPNLPTPPLTANQQQLADAMVRYWTQFARLGNPNGLSAPLWTRYLPPLTDRLQSLVPPSPQASTETAFATDHKCAFWASLVPH
jgi:para-nitrobenzyl esterase